MSTANRPCSFLLTALGNDLSGGMPFLLVALELVRCNKVGLVFPAAGELARDKSAGLDVLPHAVAAVKIEQAEHFSQAEIVLIPLRPANWSTHYCEFSSPDGSLSLWNSIAYHRMNVKDMVCMRIVLTCIVWCGMIASDERRRQPPRRCTPPPLTV